MICALLGACSGPADDGALFAVTFDPCEPVVLAPVDASADELASLEAAAAMWSEVGIGTVSVSTALPAGGGGAQHIPVHFEDAAPAFFGFYDPDRGILYINDQMDDHLGRSITAAHELGHAFGLRHIDARASIMNRGNLETPPNEQDAAAIAELWGSCEPEPPPPPVTTR